jgi:gamma-glutamyltranspeptidase/glutathione hydrolase
MTARSARGRRAAVASGHPLATAAARDVLAAGGNAVDAGVAGGIMLSVVHSDLVNFAGVAPIIVKPPEGPATTIDGVGVWPEAASARLFAERFDGAIPEGLLRTVVPAAPAAWIRALRDFGTMPFAAVAAAAIEVAREGFEVYPLFAEFIAANADRYARWPANAAIYLPGGRSPAVGERFRQTDLADVIEAMAHAEASGGGGRVEGLQRARDAFYRGEIAARIVAHHRDHGGLLTRADLEDYAVRTAPPLSVRHLGAEVLTCGSWCQGVSLAQALSMLDRIDFGRDAAPSDPDVAHRVLELLKLVFADREAFVADPAVAPPAEARLLDPAFLEARLARIDPARAAPGMPPAGDDGTAAPAPAPADPRLGEADTSQISVIDADGMMFAATPSDTSCDTEVIPGLGICPSSRGSQSRGVVGAVGAVAPGVRPRLTPNPALALENGAPWLAFGTPGGDVQIQAMVQMLENRRRFGMDLAEAVAAPRHATFSFPNSFAPNQYLPGRVMIEAPLADRLGEPLAMRGHDVRLWPELCWKAGGICAVEIELDGARRAVADPRRAGDAAAL